MDGWNKSTHAKSGLIERVKASTLTEADVEERMAAFSISMCRPTCRRCAATRCIRTGVSWRATCPGSRLLHYAIFDISTLKELAKRWKPAIMSGFAKHGKHEALADIHESIEELKYYREHFLSCESEE